MTRRVVITGLGAVTPVGNDVPTMWSNLLAGKSGAGPITLFDATAYKTRFACEVKDFDAVAGGRQEGRAPHGSLHAVGGGGGAASAATIAPWS